MTAPGDPDVRVVVMPSSTGWAFSVIDGDGSEPGSLHAAEFCFETFDDAWMAARMELKRVLKQKACAHEFTAGLIGRTCRLCHYHDWNGQFTGKASSDHEGYT